MPALEDGEAGADVAQGEHEVEGPVTLVDRGLAPLDADPVSVGEHDLLGGVVESGVDQDGPALLLERLLGNPGRAVRRADGGERGDGRTNVPAALAKQEIVAKSVTGLTPAQRASRPAQDVGPLVRGVWMRCAIWAEVVLGHAGRLLAGEGGVGGMHALRDTEPEPDPGE